MIAVPERPLLSLTPGASFTPGISATTRKSADRNAGLAGDSSNRFTIWKNRISASLGKRALSASGSVGSLSRSGQVRRRSPTRQLAWFSHWYALPFLPTRQVRPSRSAHQVSSRGTPPFTVTAVTLQYFPRTPWALSETSAISFRNREAAEAVDAGFPLMSSTG